MAAENFTENQEAEDKELSLEFIESLFEQGPQITQEQSFQIEEIMGGQELGIARRISLATLTKSMKELCDIGEQNAEVLAYTLEQTEYFLERLKSMLELAEAASARMLIVDCHVRAVTETAA